MQITISRRGVLVAAVVVALAIGAGIAWAASSSGSRATASSLIHGCYAKKTGVLRIASSCKSNEIGIQWNTIGPTGPRGPKGSPGARGPRGLPGPPVNVELRSSGSDSVPPGSFGSADAICRAGTRVVGGGWAPGYDTDLLVPTTSSLENMEDGRQGWYVVMYNLGKKPGAFGVWAFCLTQ